MKKSYTRPFVIEDCQLQIEQNFLVGSVVDQMSVETAGQENAGLYDVTEVDSVSGDYTFNHDWQ